MPCRKLSKKGAQAKRLGSVFLHFCGDGDTKWRLLGGATGSKCRKAFTQSPGASKNVNYGYLHGST
jgi:hypothetical protein